VRAGEIFLPRDTASGGEEVTVCQTCRFKPSQSARSKVGFKSAQSDSCQCGPMLVKPPRQPVFCRKYARRSPPLDKKTGPHPLRGASAIGPIFHLGKCPGQAPSTRPPVRRAGRPTPDECPCDNAPPVFGTWNSARPQPDRRQFYGDRSENGRWSRGYPQFCRRAQAGKALDRNGGEPRIPRQTALSSSHRRVPAICHRIGKCFAKVFAAIGKDRIYNVPPVFSRAAWSR